MLIKYIALLVFSAIPALIVALRYFWESVYLWQIKEYRLDRVISHYQYDNKSDKRKKVFTYVEISALFFLCLLFFFPNVPLLLLFALAPFVIYIFELDQLYTLLKRRELKRPKLKSVRNLLMLFAGLTLMLIPYILIVNWLYSILGYTGVSAPGSGVIETPSGSLLDFSVLTPYEENGITIYPLGTALIWLISILNISVVVLAPYIAGLFALLTEPLAQYRRHSLVSKAKNILSQNKDIKIIGITGSYGKTTTKELLYTILKDDFDVVKTPENKNTDVGIAITIIDSINPKTEILIAEMGAYKIGEIRKATKLAPPDISIVTGLEEQHLSLFENMDNLFKAKYEIIEGLKSDGIAILNGDNEYCLKMAGITSKEKILYFSVNDELKIAANNKPDIKTEKDAGEAALPTDKNIYAKYIKEGQNGVEFTLFAYGKDYAIKTNIPGKHNVLNLLAAVASALQLGMNVEAVVSKINSSKFLIPYFKEFQSKAGFSVIDDGYNSSYSGFKAALEYSRNKKHFGKFWVFTQGIIELGDAKNKIYTNLAQELLNNSQGLITTDKHLAEIIKKQKGTHTYEVIYDKNIEIVPGKIIEKLGEKDLLLLEGSVPVDIFNQIINKTPENATH